MTSPQSRVGNGGAVRASPCLMLAASVCSMSCVSALSSSADRLEAVEVASSSRVALLTATLSSSSSIAYRFWKTLRMDLRLGLDPRACKRRWATSVMNMPGPAHKSSTGREGSSRTPLLTAESISSATQVGVSTSPKSRARKSETLTPNIWE